jgi:putative transposase
MVERPEEYRYSSAAAHLVDGRDRSAVLDMEFWRRAGGAETWREMHGSEQSEGQVQELRKCTYAGRPFGDAGFVDTLAAQFGRRWRGQSVFAAKAGEVG